MQTLTPSKSFAPQPGQFRRPPLASRQLNNSISEYFFLDSEPLLGESKEFNNQGSTGQESF